MRRVNAKWVVIATHYPIINFPGFYFLRMHQTRSYVLGINNVLELHGMYLDIREYGLSFRSEGNTLLLGGAGHRCGKNPAAREAPGRYQVLRKNAGTYQAENCYQSAQDCDSRLHTLYRTVFQIHRPLVATNKWGMTSSMVVAIYRRPYNWRKNEARVFRPTVAAKSIAINIATEGFRRQSGCRRRPLPLTA